MVYIGIVSYVLLENAHSYEEQNIKNVPNQDSSLQIRSSLDLFNRSCHLKDANAAWFSENVTHFLQVIFI